MKRSLVAFLFAVIVVSALCAVGAIVTKKAVVHEATPQIIIGYKAGKVTDHVMTQTVYQDGRIRYNYTVVTTDADNYYDLIGRPTNKIPIFSMYPYGASGYCTSDYWLIPARAATGGHICWPDDVC